MRKHIPRIPYDELAEKLAYYQALAKAQEKRADRLLYILAETRLENMMRSRERRRM